MVTAGHAQMHTSMAVCIEYSNCDRGVGRAGAGADT